MLFLWLQIVLILSQWIELVLWASAVHELSVAQTSLDISGNANCWRKHLGVHQVMRCRMLSHFAQFWRWTKLTGFCLYAWLGYFLIIKGSVNDRI